MVERYPVCRYRNVPAAFDHFLKEDARPLAKLVSAAKNGLATFRLRRLYPASRPVGIAS